MHMHSSTPGPAPLRSDAGGFDFTSGYSRPPGPGPATATSPVGVGGGYRQASPGPAELHGSEHGQQQQGGYPGYKAYSPA
jgi:hypothetical protein